MITNLKGEVTDDGVDNAVNKGKEGKEGKEKPARKWGKDVFKNAGNILLILAATNTVFPGMFNFGKINKDTAQIALQTAGVDKGEAKAAYDKGDNISFVAFDMQSKETKAKLLTMFKELGVPQDLIQKNKVSDENFKIIIENYIKPRFDLEKDEARRIWILSIMGMVVAAMLSFGAGRMRKKDKKDKIIDHLAGSSNDPIKLQAFINQIASNAPNSAKTSDDLAKAMANELNTPEEKITTNTKDLEDLEKTKTILNENNPPEGQDYVAFAETTFKISETMPLVFSKSKNQIQNTVNGIGQLMVDLKDIGDTDTDTDDLELLGKLADGESAKEAIIKEITQKREELKKLLLPVITKRISKLTLENEKAATRIAGIKEKYEKKIASLKGAQSQLDNRTKNKKDILDEFFGKDFEQDTDGIQGKEKEIAALQSNIDSLSMAFGKLEKEKGGLEEKIESALEETNTKLALKGAEPISKASVGDLSTLETSLEQQLQTNEIVAKDNSKVTLKVPLKEILIFESDGKIRINKTQLEAGLDKIIASSLNIASISTLYIKISALKAIQSIQKKIDELASPSGMTYAEIKGKLTELREKVPQTEKDKEAIEKKNEKQARLKEMNAAMREVFEKTIDDYIANNSSRTEKQIYEKLYQNFIEANPNLVIKYTTFDYESKQGGSIKMHEMLNGKNDNRKLWAGFEALALTTAFSSVYHATKSICNEITAGLTADSLAISKMIGNINDIYDLNTSRPAIVLGGLAAFGTHKVINLYKKNLKEIEKYMLTNEGRSKINMFKGVNLALVALILAVVGLMSGLDVGGAIGVGGAETKKELNKANIETALNTLNQDGKKMEGFYQEILDGTELEVELTAEEEANALGAGPITGEKLFAAFNEAEHPEFFAAIRAKKVKGFEEGQKKAETEGGGRFDEIRENREKFLRIAKAEKQAKTQQKMREISGVSAKWYMLNPGKEVLKLQKEIENIESDFLKMMNTEGKKMFEDISDLSDELTDMGGQPVYVNEPDRAQLDKTMSDYETSYNNFINVLGQDTKFITVFKPGTIQQLYTLIKSMDPGTRAFTLIWTSIVSIMAIWLLIGSFLASRRRVDKKNSEDNEDEVRKMANEFRSSMGDMIAGFLSMLPGGEDKNLFTGILQEEDAEKGTINKVTLSKLVRYPEKPDYTGLSRLQKYAARTEYDRKRRLTLVNIKTMLMRDKDLKKRVDDETGEFYDKVSDSQMTDADLLIAYLGGKRTKNIITEDQAMVAIGDLMNKSTTFRKFMFDRYFILSKFIEPKEELSYVPEPEKEGLFRRAKSVLSSKTNIDPNDPTAAVDENDTTADASIPATPKEGFWSKAEKKAKDILDNLRGKNKQTGFGKGKK